MDRTIIDRLRNLRTRAHDLGATIADDLKPFRHATDKLTFRRRPKDPSKTGDVGVTSTCSCLMALVMAGKWRDRDLYEDESKVSQALDSIMKAPWMSSGLDESNAFTTTLVLRAFGFLTQSATLRPLLKPDVKHDSHPSSDKSLPGIAKDS